ncbi:hypothetical protein BCV71DRAFT_256617 [Rhizopus microsporus]|uniref:Uncharacterized protein n=1 Tax=Rhizopus microsporus TaxID=58291 RepID=A0A1X0RX53_RHIZD|nr:hypothetical protein BCV71DRAFT_256617 [Rhizopus microsporus]
MALIKCHIITKYKEQKTKCKINQYDHIKSKLDSLLSYHKVGKFWGYNWTMLYRKTKALQKDYKKHHVYLFDDNVNKSEWYYICKEDTTTSLDNIEVKNEFKVDLRIIQNEIVQPLDTVV